MPVVYATTRNLVEVINPEIRAGVVSRVKSLNPNPWHQPETPDPKPKLREGFADVERQTPNAWPRASQPERQYEKRDGGLSLAACH